MKITSIGIKGIKIRYGDKVGFNDSPGVWIFRERNRLFPTGFTFCEDTDNFMKTIRYFKTVKGVADVFVKKISGAMSDPNYAFKILHKKGGKV